MKFIVKMFENFLGHQVSPIGIEMQIRFVKNRRRLFFSQNRDCAALRPHFEYTFAERRGFSLAEICFMGDDVNDLEAMRIAGMSAAPASAVPAARQCASFVSTKNGGNGAVRELVDAVLEARAKA